jgi:predicted ArsR family transcriptional regulator
MTTLQQQARALGDPTRHEIFRYVVDAARPVDVPELTENFGLNHNAIRQHLAKLVDAELVIEETAPASGRGRPRLCYTLAPSVESRWGVTGPYERLSLLLSEIVRTGDSPVEVGRRAGRRLRLGSTTGLDPVAELVNQMARQGFDPTVRQRHDDVDMTLRTCPFATTALADPDTVCGLHLGIAYGIAESVDGLVIDELIPKDPRRAHCRLRCHVEAHSVQANA